MKQDFIRGFFQSLPAAITVGAYGIVLGVLAAGKEVSPAELLFMDITNFAGTGQFVMIDMLQQPPAFLQISLAVIAINFRYILIGASLRPLFIGKSFLHKCLMMHLVADENWAVTMGAHFRGEASSYFLFGGGVCVLLFWCAGTLTGAVTGLSGIITDIKLLDFVIIAVFLAIAVSLFRGHGDILPWIVAGSIALISAHYVPGKWYVILGGLGGALVTLFQQESVEAGDVIAE